MITHRPRSPARRRALAGVAALATGLGARAQATRPSTARPEVQVLAEALRIPALDRERTLRLCLPPSYATQPQRRYPVLYLHDGQNLFDDATAYAGEWGVDETMHALAAATGFEAIVVGIDHGGDRRIAELSPWPHARATAAEGFAWLDFLVDGVKPLVDARWRTRSDAASTLVGGSSLGALISQVAIHRHPQVFGRALLFSPAYWIAAPQLRAYVEVRPLPKTARIYLYAGGREDETMVPLAREMHELLRQQGAAATLHVVPEARHHEAAWRAEFEPALRWLFELS